MFHHSIFSDILNEAERRKEGGEMTKTPGERKVKKVSFSLSAPEASRVFLAGDFNGWDPTANPLKKDRRGVWKVSLNLLPGTYQYRFFVDGDWQNDPVCTDCLQNPFGSWNCVKRVE
jgi:1,4-alpha-glucan branching enzyme